LIAINRENRWLKQFLSNQKIHLVIADNRYGLYNKKVSSVFITHQLSIKTPFGKLVERILRKINYKFLERFSECWIPDFGGSRNLGGELSHPPKMPFIPVRYLGRLSRLVEEQSPSQTNGLLAIVSGPEPQRSIFEEKLVSQLKSLAVPAVIVRGLPGEKDLPDYTGENLVIFNHLPAAALNEYINRAEIVISRPGYSTVMDLIGYKKKLIFVPTPGQAEQEYLAWYLASRKFCLMYNQQHLNLGKAVAKARDFVFDEFEERGNAAYQDVISRMVNTLENVK
jgi:UDP-N-acetylglucosamine transferase subunit ALG13